MAYITRDVVMSYLEQGKVTKRSKDGLDCFCYSATLNLDDSDDQVLKDIRGLIFDGDKLVSAGFGGYTPMYSVYGVPLEQQLLIEKMKPKAYVAQEGTLLNLFYYNSRWWLVTFRNLDAYISKFGCQTSFGKQFEDAIQKCGYTNIDEFYSTLNANYRYLFLVCNTEENRLVCKGTCQTFHVATYDSSHTLVEEHIPNVHQQVQIETIQTFEDVRTAASLVDISDGQGIILFFPDGHQIKVCSNQYFEMYNLRGNQPSVPFRYLELRLSLERGTFLSLYPEWMEKFDEIEAKINNAVEKITDSQEVYDSLCEVIPSVKDVDRTDMMSVCVTLNALSPSVLNKVLRELDRSCCEEN